MIGMRIKIAIIVAAADNNVIGNEGGMPWRLSTDLKRFKALTLGKSIIMGRKTFEAIGKALPGRTSIVVTRDKQWQAPGVVAARSLESALEIAREVALASNVDEICIVGGGEIYRQSIGLADIIHLTRVHASPGGDTQFPLVDAEFWSEIRRQSVPAGEKDTAETTYLVYEKRK